MTHRLRFSTADFNAALFDMDGVVTDTTAAHAAAWKRLFDEYLEQRSSRGGETFRPFDAEGDYHRYVDGKPRNDGVESFLELRGIKLPRGSPDDDLEQNTICGLANRKDRYFSAWLAKNKIRAFPGTQAFIDVLRRAGFKIAVFSSSHHATAVLRSAEVLGTLSCKSRWRGFGSSAPARQAQSCDAVRGRSANQSCPRLLHRRRGRSCRCRGWGARRLRPSNRN